MTYQDACGLVPRECRAWPNWAVCGVLVAMLSAWPAAAATVYRCGPGGKLFSQTPCPHEDGQRLDVDAEVSGARQAEALEVARREAATARSMGRQVSARAPKSRGAAATVIPLREVSVGGAPAPARALRPKRRDTPRDFTAKVPKAAAPP